MNTLHWVPLFARKEVRQNSHTYVLHVHLCPYTCKELHCVYCVFDVFRYICTFLTFQGLKNCRSYCNIYGGFVLHNSFQHECVSPRFSDHLWIIGKWGEGCNRMQVSSCLLELLEAFGGPLWETGSWKMGFGLMQWSSPYVLKLQTTNPVWIVYRIK